ncbi:neurotrypsin-like [Amphiura filiformis]|uniref:neurotrypsin-like n=1 Tax=Amphiura filiformis TaxID=82378 RepID=UPI003B22790A
MYSYVLSRKYNVKDSVYIVDVCVVCALFALQCISAEPVRLVNGTGPSEGRLEIFVDKQWHTVWDDYHNKSPGPNEAQVVCQQLGFPGPAVVTNSGMFGPGLEPKDDDLRRYFPFHCTKIDRAKTPTHIGECDKYQGQYYWNKETWTDHSLDIGIVCNVTWPPLLRLIGGSGPHEGRLEVLFKEEWGSICRDPRLGGHVPEEWINKICRTFGYNSGRMLPAKETNFGSSQGPIWLTDIDCLPILQDLDSYYDIYDCIDRWGNDGLHCDHTDDVAFICNASDPTIPTTIRLVGGTGPHEGRVEVQTNGKWGRLGHTSTKWISTPNWEIPYPDGVANDFSASVICQQLGYSNVDAYETAPDVFGPGTEMYMIS